MMRTQVHDETRGTWYNVRRAQRLPDEAGAASPSLYGKQPHRRARRHFGATAYDGEVVKGR